MKKLIYESTIFLDQFSRNLEFAKQVNRIAIISKRKLIFYWRKIKIISFTFFVIFILVFFFQILLMSIPQFLQVYKFRLPNY